VLKDIASPLFPAAKQGELLGNRLTIQIQPEQDIGIRFNVKSPGIGLRVEPIDFSYCHSCHFHGNTKEAYENLLSEALAGNQTLFARQDEVMASWNYIDKVCDIVKTKYEKPPVYAAGSWGPKEVEELFMEKGRKFITH
jgi:glucose-6-phosphate 1-dehydrogenase